MQLGFIQQTYLEKRFKIRPAGVVSKNDMGLLKMAKAMRSCSFLDAYCLSINRPYVICGRYIYAYKKIGSARTSIEQKIHSNKVWKRTKAEYPMPKAK